MKKRKLEYMEWFQTGPGSWQQQRPKLLQLLEAMQQQGLYDPEATLQDPPSPAIAAADTDPDADTDTAAAGEEEEAAADSPASSSSSSTSSSRASGRPLGMLGIGWGSFIGLHAAGDDAVVAAGAKVLVALSPATYNKDYDITTKLQLPVCLLPAKYDTMDQVKLSPPFCPPPPNPSGMLVNWGSPPSQLVGSMLLLCACLCRHSLAMPMCACATPQCLCACVCQCFRMRVSGWHELCGARVQPVHGFSSIMCVYLFQGEVHHPVCLW